MQNNDVTINYNIPSNNRELQLIDDPQKALEIITYQVITGNYSRLSFNLWNKKIITYQVITGNYSCAIRFITIFKIITYQVITGNYSRS